MVVSEGIFLPAECSFLIFFTPLTESAYCQAHKQNVSYDEFIRHFVPLCDEKLVLSLLDVLFLITGFTPASIFVQMEPNEKYNIRDDALRYARYDTKGVSRKLRDDLPIFPDTNAPIKPFPILHQANFHFPIISFRRHHMLK